MFIVYELFSLVFCYGRNKFKWFPIWAIVNKSAVNVHVHVLICDLLWMCVSRAFEEYQEVEFHLWAPVSPLKLLPNFWAVPHPECPHSPPDALCRVPSTLVFFFFLIIFIWGCTGSSLLCSGFSLVVVSRGLLCSGFFRGAQAPGMWGLQQLRLPSSRCAGSVGAQEFSVPRHVESSQTRDQTPVPCIGRQILSHWTTREVLLLSWLLSCGVSGCGQNVGVVIKDHKNGSGTSFPSSLGLRLLPTVLCFPWPPFIIP